MKQPTTDFKYPEESDAPDEQSIAQLQDSYALLKTAIEFATQPRTHISGKMFKTDLVGNRLLAVVYAIDPTLLGVSSKDELLKLMRPATTRRNLELHMDSFKALIAKNRGLFRLGSPNGYISKPLRKVEFGKADEGRPSRGDRGARNAVYSQAQGKRGNGCGMDCKCSPSPHPGKESLINA